MSTVRFLITFESGGGLSDAECGNTAEPTISDYACRPRNPATNAGELSMLTAAGEFDNSVAVGEDRLGER